MTLPSAFASKGLEVEEWADRRFFRPVGFRLARALQPTRVSADQVTAGSLVLGLIAGHLLFYTRPWLNLAGVALFVGSDVLDSADGQLARMRGTSSRAGRMLDGISDSLRFVNLYLHLLARLLVAGWGWEAASALVLAAVVSHSFQSAAVDFVRNAYVSLGLGRPGELDLPRVTSRPTAGSLPQRVTQFLYGDYLRRQAWLFPQTVGLVGSLENGALPMGIQGGWRARQARTLAVAAWIGQNIRFALLLVTACAGWPAGFLWITAGPLNAILAALVMTHERTAASLLHPLGEAVTDA